MSDDEWEDITVCTVVNGEKAPDSERPAKQRRDRCCPRCGDAGHKFSVSTEGMVYWGFCSQRCARDWRQEP